MENYRNFILKYPQFFNFFSSLKSCQITEVVSPLPIKVPFPDCFFADFTVTGDIFVPQMWGGETPPDPPQYVPIPPLRSAFGLDSGEGLGGGGFPPDPPLYGLRPRLARGKPLG